MTHKTMTVGDLRKALQAFDPNAMVEIVDEQGHLWACADVEADEYGMPRIAPGELVGHEET